MDGMTQQVILEIVNSIDAKLWVILLKSCGVFFFTLLVTNILRTLVVYVRLRFSDLLAKRTVIEYDGFRGVIEEISMNGIFIRNKKGDTKYVPLNRWQFGSIVYPSLNETECDEDKE